MHLHFEQNISSRTECTIHSLSWMGKVPDLVTNGSGETQGATPRRPTRTQYYSEGWLASGNAKGIVGVTFTASHCRKYDPPNRSNFNLRGHRAEVTLVRWNEPYQKLATCDTQGIIFVWIKHEGRWSIELINDRNSQVTDFAWSHDGNMALICYCDGFVLVGSVAGHRYWSSVLNLDNTCITCGVWSPDDQKVMFGTTDGQIIVMSSTGAMITQITILDGMEITSLLWSCEKFKMEENSRKDSVVTVASDSDEGGPGLHVDEREHTLAVCFKYGSIYFMNNYDDVCPRIVHSMLTGLKMDWSHCGLYLAVGGFTRMPNLLCQNEVHFYTPSGELAHWEPVPSQGKPLTALCWGHYDRRLFIAAGHQLHVAWVVKHVPSLQYLTQRSVQALVNKDHNIEKLPLPAKLCSNLQALFTPTIKSYIPDPFKLRAFVSTPPPGSERMFCTMVYHGDEASGGHYTLYLEYLGGLIPLLKGKRASKLRPDFIIFDPKIKAKGTRKNGTEQEGVSMYDSDPWSESSTSDSDIETDGCGGSPRVPRRKSRKQFRPDRVERSTTFRTLNDLFYNDNLPESSKLVEVLSNIWGTKFRIVGTAAHLPEDLGNVLYKTSLLHLQPRQMTVTVTEMPRDNSLLAQDQNFTPTGVEEESDGMSLLDGLLSGAHNEHFMKFNNIPNGQLDSLTSTDNEIISVDLLTNHLELSSHVDNGLDTGSTVNCYPDRQQISVCMKTKLSPASETHPQNNHAFNVGEESLVINNSNYGGARPKVPRHGQFATNQAFNDDSGVVGVISSNLMNNSKLYSSFDSPTSARSSSTRSSISSQSSNKSQVTESQAGQKSNSAIVGDYFFANIECNYSDHTGDDNVKTSRPDSIHTNKHVPSFVDQYIRKDNPDMYIQRWADPACQGLKYADEDDQTSRDTTFEGNIVFDSSQGLTPSSESQKRLYLDSDPVNQGSKSTDDSDIDRLCDQQKLLNDKKKFKHDFFKSEKKRSSVDSSDTGVVLRPLNKDNLPKVKTNDTEHIPNGLDKNSKEHTDYNMSLLSEFERMDITQTTSLPSSPFHVLHKPDSPTVKLKEELIKNGKCRHHSPLFKRKAKLCRSIEMSDDDNDSSAEDVRISSNYKNLESFQKAQLKHKLRKALNKRDKRVSSRQFTLHNKAPLWNENSQVYQLDFGGRVTQESAKNFQVEHRGKQVMQFGRIDSNAYTLDFQYPFTAIQAFAVSLANVTQRLK
ncbi:tubby-related protein 4-like isoform X1 [Mya arenaria]|nr:tubby-related protein 4-like isoform X1 [Mya arenaria]XP_052808904.1 tubby-related protein 4-like isoform X1 [Mya arenaria]XP_052808905.1 tubby-related protein 4-like isoform X1 [Mya arenaria]